MAIGDFLVVQDELEPADLIHVLGGGLDRVAYGVQLYRQDYSRQIFFTSRGSVPEYKVYAVGLGARPEDLLPDNSSAISTYEEALELKQFLETRPAIRKVIIVSDPYHLRRAQWTLKKVLGDRVVFLFAPIPFGAGRYAVYHRRWWTDGLSCRMVFSEYVKLVYYYLRYQVFIID